MTAIDAPATGLADGLRAWRRRRRISQLELALRAGTTQRHVSFIERGRSQPGRAMIVRLAEALEVPLRHRNALLLAAGYAPAYPETALADDALGPLRAALERILDGHDPCPAVVIDRDGEMVSANAAFARLTGAAAQRLGASATNLPRLLLHPDGLASDIINFPEWGWHVADGVRRLNERDPSPRRAAVLDELERLLPPRPRDPSPHHLGFAVPLRLRAPGGGELTLLTTLTHFATAVDVTVAELTLEAFLPADAATASALAH